MKANPTGLILWILGATGVFLLYCAVKGYTPASVLAAFINRKTQPIPFASSAAPNGGTSSGGMIPGAPTNAPGGVDTGGWNPYSIPTNTPGPPGSGYDPYGTRLTSQGMEP